MESSICFQLATIATGRVSWRRARDSFHGLAAGQALGAVATSPSPWIVWPSPSCLRRLYAEAPRTTVHDASPCRRSLRLKSTPPLSSVPRSIADVRSWSIDFTGLPASVRPLYCYAGATLDSGGQGLLATERQDYAARMQCHMRRTLLQRATDELSRMSPCHGAYVRLESYHSQEYQHFQNVTLLSARLDIADTQAIHNLLENPSLTACHLYSPVHGYR